MRTIILIILFSMGLYAKSNWIYNTSHLSQSYIYGVGISNDANPVNKRQIAIINARANLAENIKVEIKSYFKMVSTSNNTNYNMKTESIIEQKASELLINSSVEDSFMDKNNVLYILIKIKNPNNSIPN